MPIPPANGPKTDQHTHPGEAAIAWEFDDDLAIGCESAHPALQIERWSLECGTLLLRPFN